MIIRTLDEAEAAVREILSADDPRKAMLRMPQLIASCVGGEVRSFLEEAQRRMGEKYGTRIIRRPVVIPGDDDLDEPPPPPRRRPRAADPRPTEPIDQAAARSATHAVDAHPTVVDAPAPDTGTVLETPPARRPAAKAEPTPSEKRPAVPRLKPLSGRNKPRAASGGASMRTSDPKVIAAELASAADTGEHPDLPRYAGRPRERTEVVTLLGESDMLPEDGAEPASDAQRPPVAEHGTTKILDRPASPAGPDRDDDDIRRPTTNDGDTSVVGLEEPAPPVARRRSSGLNKTRVYSNPSLDPVPADAQGEDAIDAAEDADELIDELTASRVFNPNEEVTASQFLRQVAPEAAPAPGPEAEELGLDRALERDEVEQLPDELREIVDELGAAQTLHGDRVIGQEPTPTDPVAPDEPPSRRRNEVMEIDAAELEAMTAQRRAAAAAKAEAEAATAAETEDDDDDVMELDAAQMMPTDAEMSDDSAVLFGQMMAESPDLGTLRPEPFDLDATDEDDDDTREIEGDPVAALLVPAPAEGGEGDTPDPRGDPDDVFDSIEGALRTGVLPLETNRQGLSADEAGELFSAFLEAAGGDQSGADVGEDTIVMDRGTSSRKPGAGAGGRVDAITLFRVIRRIFSETHQRLPAWLVARTIMSDPPGVLELSIAALRLREQREYLAYKETVAELFQRILATRLKFGKTADETGRYLQRVVQSHAPESEHERLGLAIDAVLMSDRRVAEVRGYIERGAEGERAALSLLESLGPGRALE